MHDGVAQTPHQVYLGNPLLVVGDQVGFHKDGASFREFNRPIRGQGNVLKLPHNIDSIFVGQLMEKAPRSCGTDFVHVKIQGIGVGDIDVF